MNHRPMLDPEDFDPWPLRLVHYGLMLAGVAISVIGSGVLL